jgi:hypothetical protein
MLNSLIGIIASSGGAAGGGGASYESIASQTLGSNASSITFSSIAADWQHLQLRYLLRTTGTSTGFDEVRVRLNGSTSAIHSSHNLRGDGSTIQANDSTSASVRIVLANVAPRNGNTSNIFGVGILDFHDYRTAGKNRVMRSFAGGDLNGSGAVLLHSGAAYSTTALTSIELYPDADQWLAGSVFSLYGIKGA